MMAKPRRGSRNVARIHDHLSDLLGKRVDGGCDHCDAYQTVHIASYGATIRIHHDHWCPTLNSRAVPA
jgi:hypothetical protein